MILFAMIILGFGSAAKYVAMAFSGINLDVRSLPGVYIGVVMGRHAGFLAASSALLKKRKMMVRI